MKKLLLPLSALILIGSASANDHSAAATDPKKAEMMKAWQEASTPGPEHAMLKGLVGKWKVTSKSWETEGSKPEETTGMSTFKSILGGRFVQQDYKGKMMGMPYTGTGMLGFNNVTKKFESSWYDSMSTAAMTFEGTFDASTKTLSEAGEYECPIRKGPQKMRSEMKIIDKNNMTFALYMPDMVSGKEYKTMEQAYKRMR
jgi:hypothetical protein